jgi:hypothetical protein
VSGIVAELFPCALGDEAGWEKRGLRMQAGVKEVNPTGTALSIFDNRGSYGGYFAHRLRGGHAGLLMSPLGHRAP